MRDVLFDVPVYRVDPKAWRAEVDAHVARGLEAFDRSFPEASAKSRRDQRVRLERFFTKDLPRDFNDVMGWVRVIRDGPGPVIKGYGYRVRQSRIRRGFEHTCEYIDKVFECWFHDGQTSEEIAGELRQDLVAVTRSGREFAGRHILGCLR